MTMTTQNEEIVSDLETLIQNYDNILLSYTGALNGFITFEQTNGRASRNNNVTNRFKVLKIMSNKKINGTNVFRNSLKESVYDCSGQCATVANCTMANYNSNNKQCKLSTNRNNVTISSGTESDYAIVSEQLYYTTLLKDLNDQLMTANDEIISVLLSRGNANYNELYLERQNIKNELEDNYTKLMNEQSKIKQLMSDSEKLDLEYTQTDSELIVNSYYYWFALLLIIVIICILIIFKFTAMPKSQSNFSMSNTSFNNSGSNIYYLLIALAILAMILYYYMRIRNT